MFHTVFCRSDRRLTRFEMEQLVWEGSFFDEVPKFGPPANDEDQKKPWHVFEVIYAEGKRPVQFERDEGEDVKEEVDEASMMIKRRGFSRADIVARLRETTQVIVVEFDELLASEEALEMIDVIEMELARALDGIIYSPEEGFFDGRNQPIVKWCI